MQNAPEAHRMPIHHPLSEKYQKGLDMNHSSSLVNVHLPASCIAAVATYDFRASVIRKDAVLMTPAPVKRHILCRVPGAV